MPVSCMARNQLCMTPIIATTEWHNVVMHYIAAVPAASRF